ASRGRCANSSPRELRRRSDLALRPAPVEQHGAAFGSRGDDIKGRRLRQLVVQMLARRVGEPQRELEAPVRKRQRIDVEASFELSRFWPPKLGSVDTAAGEQAAVLVAQVIVQPGPRQRLQGS